MLRAPDGDGRRLPADRRPATARRRIWSAPGSTPRTLAAERRRIGPGRLLQVAGPAGRHGLPGAAGRAAASSPRLPTWTASPRWPATRCWSRVMATGASASREVVFAGRQVLRTGVAARRGGTTREPAARGRGPGRGRAAPARDRAQPGRAFVPAAGGAGRRRRAADGQPAPVRGAGRVGAGAPRGRGARGGTGAARAQLRPGRAGLGRGARDPQSAQRDPRRRAAPRTASSRPRRASRSTGS